MDAAPDTASPEPRAQDSREPIRTVRLALGNRAIVASDFLLGAGPTEASMSAAREMAQALESFDGPGVVVVAGNLFDLLGVPDPPAEAAQLTEQVPVGERVHDLGAMPDAEVVRLAVTAHPGLFSALSTFADAGAGRHLFVLPGSRDRTMLFDDAVRSAIEALGAEIALCVDLEVETSTGTRTVRIDPGWRYDTRSAFTDPFNPADTPLAHHVVEEVLPRISKARSSWLSGVDRLADQASMPRFVASRLIYRRVVRYVWWLLIPVAFAFLVRVPGLLSSGLRGHLHPLAPGLFVAGSALIGELVLVAAALVYLNQRAWHSVGPAVLGRPGLRANDPARDAARALTREGASGLVTGHTLQPELTHLEAGFYACTGACAEIVTEHRSRLGLPPVFLHHRQVSWIEIEGGADVHARLFQARVDLPAGTVLERLASGKRRRTEHEPAVVASYPSGAGWPPLVDPTLRLRRVRRAAAAVVFLIGLLDFVSAVVPPQVKGRLHPLLHYVPLGVSKTASVLVALAALGLVALARGIRRGQRIAALITTVILAVTAALHILKNGGIVPALISLLAITYLVWFRDCFQARFDLPSLRVGIITLVGGAAAITFLTATVLEITLPITKHHELSFGSALWASATRMIGIDTGNVPETVRDWLDPTMLAIGVALIVAALALGLRPVVDRRRHTLSADARRRARDIVARRSSGTLDYFALRDDKQWFFDRDGLVAYAIYGGVCLVSPDPIGAAEERDELWASFRRFADQHGWTLAVLGASEEWLPVYRRAGMRDLYVGDEAVTDVTTFSLEGGSHKGLRQAVNRIAKYGYTMSFHDPAHIDPQLADALRVVMTKTRRGDVERGFSMTLGRIFEPDDTGLLLAVAHDPDGVPVAFCQFVPAPGINGYSLDLMRRDNGQHPNGLLDFILVNTMRKLRDEGYEHLGLNFATMRAVLAGELGDGFSQRIERWFLKRMSDSMQIESLWRFNAKFDPQWFARYVVWDSAEHSLAAGLAIARAESFWELPIIGRFLAPSPATSESEPPAGSAAPDVRAPDVRGPAVGLPAEEEPSRT